jgi:hypothetical protein
MKPKKAIEGLNYINKAIMNLDKELKIVMEKLGSKFITGAQQVNTGGKTYVSAWGKNIRFGAPGTGGGMGQAR